MQYKATLANDLAGKVNRAKEGDEIIFKDIKHNVETTLLVFNRVKLCHR